MRVIIAGSRNIEEYGFILNAIRDSGFAISTVVSGGARGVDLLGERWANEHGIPIDKHPALWDKYGKRAGFVRNDEMAQCADALIAVWDGKSSGTGMMINLANKYHLQVFTLIV